MFAYVGITNVVSLPQKEKATLDIATREVGRTKLSRA
jgi:hypothetical protein